MEQRFEKMFENEAFKALDAEKTEMIKQFVQNNQGKKVSEIFGEIIKLNSALNRGKPLNSKEKEAILEAVLTTLSAEERNKFMSVLSLLEKGF